MNIAYDDNGVPIEGDGAYDVYEEGAVDDGAGAYETEAVEESAAAE